MKKLNVKVMKYTRKGFAFLLCTAMLLTMPGMAVSATEAGTDQSATTEQAVSNGQTNADANGMLGKNSDVGVEVTKSITGTAGKKLEVAFKIKSNDTSKIKLKSVYPVIDSEFPFETSGDAYKIVTSGTDEKLQAELAAEFSMIARSDIETGYHSVRFIGEYTKLDKDGNESDYYVIKTINIYFKGAGTVPNNDNKKPSKNDKNDKNDMGDDSDDSFLPDDFEEDNSFSGDDGSEADAVAPKLVITGYETKPEKIKAGETFKLTIHIKNTSKNVSVCNGKFLIGNEAGSFLPTSGSSAVFVESIPAGTTGDLEIEMKASADLVQKNYILVVKGDFDDGKGNSFTSSDNLTVPVYQEIKLGISDISMTPEILGVDEQGSLMFTLNNKTGVGAYNVKVEVKDDAATAEECYVGNIAANSTAYATLELTGVADNADKGSITVVISFEDEEGNISTMEEQVECMISADGSSFGEDEFEGDGFEGYEGDFEEDFEEDSGIPWWLIVLIILAVLVIVAVAIVCIVLVVKKKKKQEADLLDDDDLYGEDEIENEDF